MINRVGKYEVEFLEDSHLYLVDGVKLPSITQLMKSKFGNMYDSVPKAVLKNAAQRGNAIHKAIEMYCKHGTDNESQEVRNFKFLCKKYGLKVKDNELMVILEDDDGNPIGAGTLDLLCKTRGGVLIGDIKTTSQLNKEYLFYQLNLYARAYEQTYDGKVKGLFGLHLRESKRKYVEIDLNWDMAKEILNGQ